MSRPAGCLYHPVNGYAERIHTGFSWPCFFLGFLWFAIKGMWGWAIVAVVVAFMTLGFSWLVFPFVANGMCTKHLLRKGYVGEERIRDKATPYAAHYA